MCSCLIWLRALSSDIWSAYKVFLWSLICISEEMTTVEILAIFIFLEMHRDKMRGAGTSSSRPVTWRVEICTMKVKGAVGFSQGQWDFYPQSFSELTWATDLSCPWAEQRLGHTELHSSLPSCIILYLWANNIQYFSDRNHSAVALRPSCLIWKPLCKKDNASYQAI